jgi:coenzyme F420-dependent glucose-6-phosphate dehydrogenase
MANGQAVSLKCSFGDCNEYLFIHDEVKKSTLIITSIEDCIKSIEGYFKAGFTRVYTHSTSPDEIKFIRDFCAKVLPYLQERMNK